MTVTAARGHHTDIGGLTPGSMPPDSRTIHDEGVYIETWTLVEGDRFREAETRALLTAGPHPARAPETNLADLHAQIAANQKGVDEIGAMIDTLQAGRHLPVVFLGGLGTHYARRLAGRWPIRDPLGSGLDGALLLARKEA